MNKNNYREYLEEEFQKRNQKNASYSLRAFSRDLGLAPSRLSDILNRKDGISERVALEIAERLVMQMQDREIFVLMVKAEHSRSAVGKRQAAQELEKKLGSQADNVDSKVLTLLSNWYHLAVLMYLSNKIGQVIELDRGASELKLTVEEFRHAIENLQELGMLKMDQDRRVESVKSKWKTSSEVPDQAIRKFHSQALKNAAATLTKVDNHLKETSTSFILVDEKDMPEMKKQIDQFVKGLIKTYHKQESPAAHIYQLSAQLLPVQNERI